MALTFNWVNPGPRADATAAVESVRLHWPLISAQLLCCTLSGVSILALAITEIWKHRENTESWLLALWVLGTWFFAGFVNWTVNARSVLPLIPAVGVLMLRRLERQRGFPAMGGFSAHRRTAVVAGIGMCLAALVSLLVTTSDASWANSMREAANRIYKNTRAERRTVYFAGHWGFSITCRLWGSYRRTN